MVRNRMEAAIYWEMRAVESLAAMHLTLLHANTKTSTTATVLQMRDWWVWGAACEYVVSSGLNLS